MGDSESGAIDGVAKQDADEAVRQARRAALRKIGVYGAAAPALVALLAADRAQAASPIGPPITGQCTVSPPNCTFF